MKNNENLLNFISEIEKSILENTFVSLSLANNKGADTNLKKINIKKILIKKEEKLNFTYRNKTNDIVKNYAIKEAIALIQNFIYEDFRMATLFTINFDLLLECIDNQALNKKFVLTTKPASHKNLLPLDHDKAKKRLISSFNKSYLYELKITDEKGNVFKNSQDKYRQINHYVEILSSLLKDIPPQKLNKIVDMGSGKGYLTFALYDYLHNVLGLDTEVIGVEYRNDLVTLCNDIAKNTGFEKLNFAQGTIEDYDSQNTNVLIALHACNTATDDAICKGIIAKADLIVVAPCCHKQIRQQIENHKSDKQIKEIKVSKNQELDFLLKHGIFLERQAEMVTDGIRAMILEYFGYKTKVFEFISDAHTPKNVMIVGIKNQKITVKDENILQKLKDIKTYFGIEYHYLEKIMQIV